MQGIIRKCIKYIHTKHIYQCYFEYQHRLKAKYLRNLIKIERIDNLKKISHHVFFPASTK